MAYCIAGEPPKHVKEMPKKIPSLFEIKVEPPKKPTNQNMGHNAPSHGPPPPSYYGDMMHGPPPPRIPAPHAAPGLLGPAPGMPMQNLSIPPPGYMGLGAPPPFPPPPPSNFFAPPPPIAMNQDKPEGSTFKPLYDALIHKPTPNMSAL